MPSKFGWVDFAEEDRRRMMEILHLFREQEIREELGIGTVRDAFSDTLFPGTSTLHTRAKYMLFIPWTFMLLEKKLVPSHEIESRSREAEISLIHGLLNAGEDEGVIGRLARKDLKILPSYMYWSGLGIWGIRRFQGSLQQYFRSMDGYYKQKQRAVHSDDREPVSTIWHNWDPHVVPSPNGFPYEAHLSLSFDEAEYLHDKILANCTHSLLAHLVDKAGPSSVDFVWRHPECADFREDHQNIIQHARNFSEVFYGASLLYNLMLSEKKKNVLLIENYKRKLNTWSNEIRNRFPELITWSREDFWSIVFEQRFHIIPLSTRRFVEAWIDLVRKHEGSKEISDDINARRLIYDRESRIKGKRSRLRNPQMLDQWAGASGAFLINFRWPIVQTIVNDILIGLDKR
jgi:hypothetical protein